MPLVPLEFNEIADALFHGLPIPRGAERCSRSIAGRAYYSAYLSARNAVRVAFQNPRATITHASFHRFLLAHTGVMARVGTNLKTLYLHRTRSDYFLSETVLRDEAESCIAGAADVLNDEAELSRDLARFAAHPHDWLKEDENVASLT